MIIIGICIFIILSSSVCCAIDLWNIKKVNKILFYKGEVVTNKYFGGEYNILREATVSEIKIEYPQFIYRPYKAYWVERFDDDGCRSSRCFAATALQLIE